METSADRVWTRLKKMAATWAKSSRPPPNDGEAADAVREILAQSGSTIPGPAIAFYAAELTAMIDDTRRDRDSSERF